MDKESLFEFTGTIGPKEAIPLLRTTFGLTWRYGSFDVELDGHQICVRFGATYTSFDDLFYEIYEYALAALSVSTLFTGLPLELSLEEWKEWPIDHVHGGEQRTPVRGKILLTDPDAKARDLSDQEFMAAVGQGMMWSELLASNHFFRRAVLDFNYALQHPIHDVPIYLSRALESIKDFFGGESEMLSELEIRSEFKLVNSLANDALGGRHTRHAAKTPYPKPVTREEVRDAVSSTRDIIVRFHRFLAQQRETEAQPGHEDE